MPEAEGVAETASTVSVFRDHCSRSAGPDRTRRRRGRHRDSTRRRPLTCDAAVTRVDCRERLLIFRSFALGPFQRGEDVGRNLLLRVWQGEEIDWEKIRPEYVIEKPCSECREQTGPRGYTAGQWKRDDASRVCKECVGRHEQSGHPWQCCMCKCWQPTAAFRTIGEAMEQRCYACV